SLASFRSAPAAISSGVPILPTGSCAIHPLHFFGRASSETCHHRRSYDSRACRVDADLRRCVVESGRRGETNHAMFRGGVRGLPSKPLTPAPEEVFTIALPPCFRISGIS